MAVGGVMGRGIIGTESSLNLALRLDILQKIWIVY